jgi:polar amino acid transport system substrate-binding protein
VRNAATGETKGVALDLGRAMAERLGVAFELAEFPKNADVIDAVKDGRADFAFTNASTARARIMHFSPAVLGVEQGYLVARDSPLTSAPEVDQPGRRVGVAKGSSSEKELHARLKAASLVPVPTLKEAARMLAEGGLDAFATNKAILNEMADGIPGSRILEGRYGLESMAIGIPKGREAGHGWLRAFVREAGADGTVQRAVERAGLRGTTPPEAR